MNCTPRNVLTATGAGAAATLGLGGFLVDRRRDAIYYNGAKAIYCLSISIAPIAIETGEYEQMLNDVDELRLALAIAAAAGLPPGMMDEGNSVYITGRRLVREIAQAGTTFSNELEKINLSVNTQIASNDRSISEITAAITAVQTNSISIISGITPSGRTQGGKPDKSGVAAAEADLRRSIQLVNEWAKVYQSVVSATDTRLRASQCIPSNAPNPSPSQPIVIVTNGQSVTTNPGTADAGGVSSTVINVQPSPPARVVVGSDVARNPKETPEFKCLREALGLKAQQASSEVDRKFVEQVKAFQKGRGIKDPTGFLSLTEKTALCPTLSGMPTNTTVQPPPPVISQ